MLSERILTKVVEATTDSYLRLSPTDEARMPAPEPGKRYMLYAHVPFCERLCPYCSFNRYPFRTEVARPYFANLRREMLRTRTTLFPSTWTSWPVACSA